MDYTDVRRFALPSGRLRPDHARSDRVSLLIPTYRRPERLPAILRSALASGAGEIILSDNASGDPDLPAKLAEFNDPRLRFVVQPTNLGLWGHHLALLQLARLDWVKFLHDDDFLEPDGLDAMLRHAGEATVFIATIQRLHNESTGQVRMENRLIAPLSFGPGDYLYRVPVMGNLELGVPSCGLFRREVLPVDPDLWRNDLSADWVINVLTAAQGEIVLVPPGPVVITQHSGQDTTAQGVKLESRRRLESHRALRRRLPPEYRFRVRQAEAVAGLYFLSRSVTRLMRFKPGALTLFLTGLRMALLSGGLFHPGDWHRWWQSMQTVRQRHRPQGYYYREGPAPVAQ